VVGTYIEYDISILSSGGRTVATTPNARQHLGDIRQCLFHFSPCLCRGRGDETPLPSDTNVAFRTRRLTKDGDLPPGERVKQRADNSRRSNAGRQRRGWRGGRQRRDGVR